VGAMLVALGRIWVSRCWVCGNLKTGVWEFKFSNYMGRGAHGSTPPE